MLRDDESAHDLGAFYGRFYPYIAEKLTTTDAATDSFFAR